jgi:hypothetical protein
MNSPNPFCRQPPRRAAVLVAALVCMAIVMALLGSMLLAALRSSRQLHAERDLRQCELLLAAGLDRVAYRLAKDTDYRGETWTLPAGAIVAVGDGQVTIEVAEATQQQAPQLRVVAEYPTGSETSVRRSRTILLPFKTPSVEE